MPDFPIPLPVDTGPAWADWWMVGLTAVGIVVTALIALLTLRANLTANRSVKLAADAEKNAQLANIAALEASTEAANHAASASRAQTQMMELLVERPNDRSGQGVTSGDLPPQPSAHWGLERDRAAGKNHWLLRNIGDGIAYEASLQGLTEQDQQDVMVLERREVTSVSPNQYIQFVVDRSLASPAANVIVVRWRDEFENELSMRFVVAT